MIPVYRVLAILAVSAPLFAEAPLTPYLRGHSFHGESFDSGPRLVIVFRSEPLVKKS